MQCKTHTGRVRNPDSLRDVWCRVFEELQGARYAWQPMGRDPVTIAALAKLADGPEDFEARARELWRKCKTWTGRPVPSLDLLERHWNSCVPTKREKTKVERDAEIYRGFEFDLGEGAS